MGAPIEPSPACPFCKGHVAPDAITCPHCGATKNDRGFWRSKAHKDLVLRSDGSKVKAPVVGVLAVLLVLGLGVWGCTAWVASQPGVVDVGSASLECQEQVRKRLEFPRAARYSSGFDNTVTQDADLYTVTGWVEISSSTKGWVRSPYVCQVRHNASTGAWTLVGITGLP